jgi:hypothetical protein
MPAGLPVDRQWVLVMPNGDTVVDWGDRRVQNVHSGNFLGYYPPVGAISIPDAQLEALKRAGIVCAYDHHTVYFTYLPEQQPPIIE